MQFRLKIVCLIIVFLCHNLQWHQWAPLVDSRMGFRIPKRCGLDWNDPREGQVIIFLVVDVSLFTQFQPLVCLEVVDLWTEIKIKTNKNRQFI